MEHPTPRQGHSDPYRVLGVDAGASQPEIARAYRRAVHGAHPDAQPADPRAAARFRELTGAYDLLSDPARRAAYRTHHPSRKVRMTTVDAAIQDRHGHRRQSLLPNAVPALRPIRSRQH